MNIVVRPPKTGVLNYMQQARWLLDLRSRFSPRDYTLIAALVRYSKTNAGGPALRLAYAVNDLENRLNFPKRPALALKEDNGYAHLCAEHRSMPRARRYRVWKAIEHFRDIRERLFGPPLLVDVAPPGLETRDVRFERGLYALDYWRVLTGKAYLHEALRLCVTETDPMLARPMQLFGTAVWKLEEWREAGCAEGPLRDAYLEANKALRSYQHRNGWLGKTPLGMAIGLMNGSFK